MTQNILFINHVAGFGGAEIFLRDILLHHSENSQKWKVAFLQDGPIASELRSRGCDVEIIAAGKLLSLKRGSSTKDILIAAIDIFAAIIKIAMIARNFDLICANSQKSLPVGGVVSFVLRTPFVWIAHDIVSDVSFSRLMRKQISFCCKFFTNCIIANSEATKYSLVSLGVNDRKIQVVYNGFDVDDTTIHAFNCVHKSHYLKELVLSDGPIVGLFGRLSYWKGQHVLLHALRNLPNVQAIIVGDATYEDLEYERFIKSIVIKYGMQHRVKFLGFRTDVCDLMRLSDIIVHTSIHPEPFGRVIVEGMLQKRPVIATKMGGVLEIIKDRENGLLCRPNDEVQLRELLSELLSDEALAVRLAASGYKTAVSKFSINSTVEAIEKIFNILTSEKNHFS